MRPTSRCLPLLLLLAACHDDEVGPDPTLANAWPSADGTAWTYEMLVRNWNAGEPPLHPTAAGVPVAPTLASLEKLLGTHEIGSAVQVQDGQFSLRFDGMATTDSGARGQNLVEEVDLAPAARGSRAPSAFLSRLWTARPDLRGELRALGVAPAAGRGHAPEPIFLRGYVWEKTRDWIGTYGDLDRDLAWIFLDADLEPGAEFSLQLVRSITDDVFLHGRILPRRAHVTSLGVQTNAVECLYLVDFGLATHRDLSGVILGYRRVLSYGTVLYVAGVGPVHAYQRDLVPAGTPLTPGAGDITMSLLEMTAPTR